VSCRGAGAKGAQIRVRANYEHIGSGTEGRARRRRSGIPVGQKPDEGAPGPTAFLNDLVSFGYTRGQNLAIALRRTGLCTAEYCNPSELRLDLKIVAGSEQRCHIAIFEAVDERKLRKRCALR
jgi:hypothetical protein